MRFFWHLLKQEMNLQLRHKTTWASLFLFFAVVVILIPFALGPDADMLRRLAPGLLWLAALLMSLLSLTQLFVQDNKDGMLDEMRISPLPLEAIVLAKMLAQSLIMIVILIGVTFPAALLLDMESEVLPALWVSFALGIPCLVFLGGIASAMVASLEHHAALLTLLLAPFYIPILIFATAACEAAPSSGNLLQPLLFLAALLVLIVSFAPFVIAASLREV